MNPLRQLAELGQSVYLDEIGRGMLRDGSLQRLIDEDGIHGVTSNPAIFEKAIARSGDYREAIAQLAGSGLNAAAVVEQLSLEDIGEAADRFLPLYQRSGGRAGYVSLEVAPTLADDAEATIHEAERLWGALARPNIFIKVPATPAGIVACERLTAAGVRLNMTLLFSLARYREVAEAYLRGLELRQASGQSLAGSASVASFFLSRIDVAIDPRLDALATPTAAALRGRIAIASAAMAWQTYTALFQGPRFAALAAAADRRPDRNHPAERHLGRLPQPRGTGAAPGASPGRRRRAQRARPARNRPRRGHCATRARRGGEVRAALPLAARYRRPGTDGRARGIG